MYFLAAVLLAALPSLIIASPTERSNQNKQLSKRLVPPGCGFGGRRTTYSYIDNAAGDGEGESCFGFTQPYSGKCGVYSPEESDQIKEAVRKQATKDGQLESTNVGDWTATFNLLTTAFEDRDTSGFDDTFDSVNVEDNEGAGNLEYYWQRKGDYITVRKETCSGDLFGGLFDRKQR
ncbi:MAG: hypothetical protein Q9183_005626 [Haloplaca sp. 2 TL-2023]